METAVIIKQKIADCKKICKKALNIFAIHTSLNNIDDIIFLYHWRAKLAKCGFFIKLAIDFVKALRVDFDLTVSDI